MSAAGRGWIRVAPHGRYLQHEDGTPFFAVGHAEAFGFFFQPMNPYATLEAFFRHMQENGQNTLAVQVENENLDFYGGHRLNLEYPLGTYNEDIARQFDAVLELASRYGIYVVTYLWDTFNMDFNWEKSPYNALNGGPCTYVSEMLGDPRAIALQKQKFRWAIDRWGNHRNLLCWELMNEIDWAVAGAVPANKDAQDGLHGASAEVMAAWVAEMGEFVRAYSLERHGRCPLLTVSTNNPLYDGAWFYESPQLDFITNHQYYWTDQASTYPAHPLEAAVAVRDGVRYVLERVGYRKPYLDTENGPLGWFLENPGQVFPIDAAYFHAMSWANAAAGAAGSGLRWPYPNYGFGDKPFLNPLSAAMTRDLAALARVVDRLDWVRFDSRPSDGWEVSEGCLAIACQDREQLLGWIARDSRLDTRESGSVRARFTGFAAGPHEVLWCDAHSGDVSRRDRATGSDFELETPAFTDTLAVVVRPAAGRAS